MGIRNNVPRPSKFTEAARDKVINALKAGLTRTAAAGIANVHVSQVTRWCQNNASFATDCDIAEQQAEARFTSAITKAVQDGDVKYALEWLKRRRRAEWGDNIEFAAGKEASQIIASLFAGDAEDGIGTPPLGIDA